MSNSRNNFEASVGNEASGFKAFPHRGQKVFRARQQKQGIFDLIQFISYVPEQGAFYLVAATIKRFINKCFIFMVGLQNLIAFFKEGVSP